MVLPSLDRLPLHTRAGAPRVDPDQDSAAEKVMRELRLEIVAQLAQNRGGREVCKSIASYCSMNRAACDGVDVPEVGLSAFGASTPEIRDELTTVLLGWSRPTPFRPALSAQQLFSLLCDSLVKYHPGWVSNPEAHLFGEAGFASTEWKEWYYGLLTLPSKSGVTNMEFDCLSAFFYAKNDATSKQGIGDNIGYALHGKRGDWRRIPWSNPKSAEPLSWSKLTDENAFQRLEALGDYRSEFVRIRNEALGDESLNDENLHGYVNYFPELARRRDVWVRIAISWFGVLPEDAEVLELDDYSNPLEENGTWQLLRRLNDMLVVHLREFVLKGIDQPFTFSWERINLADEIIANTTGNLATIGTRENPFESTWPQPVHDSTRFFSSSEFQWQLWCLKRPR